MAHALEYACNHPVLLFLPALLFFLLPVLPAIARARAAARKAREQEARRLAAEEKRRAAAEEKQRTEATAPKRGRGRPRKHPAPDHNAPKRPRGRPRKNPAPAPVDHPAQRPEIISSPAPAEDLAKLASENLYTPEEFLKHIG